MRLQRLRCPALVGLFVFFVSSAISGAPSNLSARGTSVEQQIAKKYAGWWERVVMLIGREAVLHFGEPVHEEITARMFDCTDDCDNQDSATEYPGLWVIAGVRWNDDPPFRLDTDQGQHTSCKTLETIRFTTQPRCWYQLFAAAKKQAEGGTLPSSSNHAPLLARSHFGDLQFLHGMASQDGEAPADTKRHIMMWEEFAWKVVTGKYKLDTKLSDVQIESFDQFFGKSGWTVQDLFTAGNPAMRRNIEDVAFGSLLHPVEDSFARGHVERETASPGDCPGLPQFPAPPQIIEFHSYGNQDEHKHGLWDGRKAFTDTLEQPVNVVTVGKPLVEFYAERADWETVKPYFECVFATANDPRLASAGQDFKK